MKEIKEDSKQLIRFFQQDNVDKIVSKIYPNTKFSNISFQFIETIFKKIINANQLLKTQSIKIQRNIIDLKKENIPHGNNYDYCPLDVRLKIESMENKIAYSYSFLISKQNSGEPGNKSNKEIRVFFIGSRNTILNPDKYFQKCIERIYLWLSIAFQYAQDHCSQYMNIYLYMTDLKKNLPKKGEPINQIHANTAFTTACQTTTEIHLFREEEWFKVLIHETFHCLGLDFSELNWTETNKKIMSIFKVQSDVRIFETYCEVWAELINIIFISFFSTNQNHLIENIPKMIKKTENMLNLEILFSVFQCCKVLNFYGLSYMELYENTSVAKYKRLMRYDEKTHILSYYILKSIFIFFIDDFITWCYNYNGGYTIQFDKKKNLERNLDSYCLFVREHYNNPGFLNIIFQMFQFVGNLNQYTNNEFIQKNLRMTILEKN
jgi:hypothetical protein